MFFELHVLHGFPQAALNRDFEGRPKTVQVGGVSRIRVSSQAWCRAIREAWRTNDADMGLRMVATEGFAEQLAQRLSDEPACEVQKLTHAMAVALSGSKMKEVPDNAASGEADYSRVMVFLSPREIDLIAKAMKGHWTDLLAVAEEENPKDTLFGDLIKQVAEGAVDRALPPDIAAFGRMAASYPLLHVYGAVTVAPAFTTHRTSWVTDQWIALADLQNKKGAGGMGESYFAGGAVFYRYASVDIRLLADNLKTDPKPTMHKFAQLFLTTVPQAANRVTGTNTLPQFILAVAKPGQPFSLAQAFEQPVPGGENGYLQPAVAKLVEHWEQMVDFYGDVVEPAFAGVAALGQQDCAFPTSWQSIKSLPDLLDNAINAIEV
jgi:CRISPR system Cascade subunit CasC